VRRGVGLSVLLAIWGVGGVARAAEVETLRQNGPTNLRFNIAVLGDGYRTADQAKLKSDAQAIIDYLFGVSPLKQYQGLFNVKLVHVISKDNGADNGTYGVTRDTALDAQFNCDNIDRLLCVDTGKVQVAALQDVPENNFAIVLVNDPKYGGSGGSVCVSSSNEDSFEVLAHEIGHSLAHLADEYSYEANYAACDPQQDCKEANATLRTARDEIKWKDWIEAATPVPTPATPQFGSAVGLFEGARYTPLGVYRPQQDCKMRDLGAEYCPVCSEQFVRAIWTAENVEMIETATPPELAVQSDTCAPIALSVTNPPVVPATYKYVWKVDGNVQLETTNAIQLLPGALMPGAHQVELAMQDATALVRTDPKGVLTDHHAWTVTVSKSDCPTTGVGGMAGGGGGGAAGNAGGAGSGGVNLGAGGAGSSAAGAGALGGMAGGASGAASMSPRPAPPPRKTPGCGCAVPGHSKAPDFTALGALLWLGLGRRRRARR
jgi:hypothetical protein